MGRLKPITSEIRYIQSIFDTVICGISSGRGGGKSIGGDTIKQCRVAYTRLLAILRDVQLRQQLGDEAIPDDLYNNNDDDTDPDGGSSHMLPHTSRKVRSMQRAVLAEMWKKLITSSVLCIQQMIQTREIPNTRLRKRKGSTTTSSTSKYYEDDVRFPFELIQLCFATDPVFDSVPPPSPSPILLPRPSDKQSHIKASTKTLPNLIPNKLGKEQSELLFRYCIDLLSEIESERVDQERPSMQSSEMTMGMQQYNCGIDTIEDILLSMLLYMCGRTELVSYYSCKDHIRTIVANIIQPRIMQGLTSPTSPGSSIVQQESQQHLATSTTPLFKNWYWFTIQHPRIVRYIYPMV
jgi:hypothetical protein